MNIHATPSSARENALRAPCVAATTYRNCPVCLHVRSNECQPGGCCVCLWYDHALFLLSHVRFLLLCVWLIVLFFSYPRHGSSWRVSGSYNSFHAATTETSSLTSAIASPNQPRNHARESPPLLE